MQSFYQPGRKERWSGRIDANAPKARFYEIVQPFNLLKDQIIKEAFYLIGFCSDEGVRRNQGREGAKEGPNILRKALANICVHAQEKNFVPQIYDAGDVICQGNELEIAQDELAKKISAIVDGRGIPCVLGGGHETSWGHFQGLIRSKKFDPKISIINFDAHFDLRTLGVDQKGNSGTPFLQINNLCRERGFKFNYNVFGIQKIANDYDLFKKAAELSVTYVVADEIINKGIAAMNIFQKIIKDAEKIYLSICLDVFNAAFAPGVSAPTAQGLSPWHLNSLIDEIRKSGKLISFDIVEFNPNYDRDTQTAKLAASYVSRILFGY